MVAAIISQEKVAAGRRLVGLLVNEQPRLHAALWLFFSDSNSWKLGFLFDEQSSAKSGYRIVLKAHATDEQIRRQIAVEELFVFRGMTPLLKALGTMVSTGESISDISFSGNVINGYVIPDCHIYYLNMPKKSRR